MVRAGASAVGWGDAERLICGDMRRIGQWRTAPMQQILRGSVSVAILRRLYIFSPDMAARGNEGRRKTGATGGRQGGTEVMLLRDNWKVSVGASKAKPHFVVLKSTAQVRGWRRKCPTLTPSPSRTPSPPMPPIRATWGATPQTHNPSLSRLSPPSPRHISLTVSAGQGLCDARAVSRRQHGCAPPRLPSPGRGVIAAAGRGPKGLPK